MNISLFSPATVIGVDPLVTVFVMLIMETASVLKDLKVEDVINADLLIFNFPFVANVIASMMELNLTNALLKVFASVMIMGSVLAK